MKEFESRLDEVLLSYSVEPEHNAQTLERYVRAYPDCAKQLIDLSIELSYPLPVSSKPLSDEDVRLVDAAWDLFNAKSQTTPTISIHELTVPVLKQLATVLDVPRQVVSAFRDSKVVVSSVPNWVLTAISETLGLTRERLVEQLSAGGQLARSNKADSKSFDTDAVTFEQLLIQSGVPPEKRAILLKDKR